MKKNNIVDCVLAGSIAAAMDICPGDRLLSVNGQAVRDVFDYRYLMQDESVALLIEKPDGEEWLLEIEKDAEEDLGMVFAAGLMDDAKRCGNRCLFCFVDQLPQGMRKTLYFKDDDARLSFLQGNYVTLTNMSAADFDRILYYHLSPINISVHTTDGALRQKMLGNRKANRLAEQTERLRTAGITMNFQVVLVKGMNDGAALDQTIRDLAGLMPQARSLSVVPVGLTKYREANGLAALQPFEKADAARVLAQIAGWQDRMLSEYGTRFVFAADEFYLKAEEPVPLAAAYEDFPQIENGVGMLAQTRASFEERLVRLQPVQIKDKTVAFATGRAAYAFIRGLAVRLTERVKGLKIEVYCIENNFFGDGITVSGLLTGGDLISQLSGKPLGCALFIPGNALRAGESVFLDDVCLADAAARLGVPVIPTDADGGLMIEAVLAVIKKETDYHFNEEKAGEHR